MKENEIFDAYEELSEPDAFEAFESRNISHETIVNVLGYDVAIDYMEWIRRNVK